MPVFKAGPGQAPEWCELERFDVLRLPVGSSTVFDREGEREKLIVVRGACTVALSDEVAVEAVADEILDIDAPGDRFGILGVTEDAIVVRMAGRWGDEVGGSGVFTVSVSADPQDCGDPVDYPKTTSFDNHFHDCDEYWIVVEGSGVAVTEGKSFEVGPGDCVATGMGWHHDFPVAREPVVAVYFETTMEGGKRGGHLWEHTHGPAEPKPERQ
jgi:mannose-6-phosphate isomerase-like protein (cupin superfamily)